MSLLGDAPMQIQSRLFSLETDFEYLATLHLIEL